MASTGKSKSVFISYSHDSIEHINWIGELACELRNAGCGVLFDQNPRYGNFIDEAMAAYVDDADVILIIMTPLYRKKVDRHSRGVGVEFQMIMNYLYPAEETTVQKKIISVLRNGKFSESCPITIRGLWLADLSNPETYADKLRKLLNYINNDDNDGDQKTAGSIPPKGPATPGNQLQRSGFWPIIGTVIAGALILPLFGVAQTPENQHTAQAPDHNDHHTNGTGHDHEHLQHNETNHFTGHTSDYDYQQIDIHHDQPGTGYHPMDDTNFDFLDGIDDLFTGLFGDF